MKRTTAVSAFVAAATLLLAGCGSDKGTSGSAAPAATSQTGPASADASTTGGSAGDSTTASSVDGSATDSSAGGSATGSSAEGSATDSSPGTSATDGSAGSSATDGSSVGSATDSSAGSSATDGSSVGSATGSSAEGSATDSSAEGSTSGGSGGSGSASTAEPSVTRTLDAGGNLDQPTTHWFDTFCTASAPLADVATAMKGSGSSDPAKMVRTLGGIYTKMGAALTDGAAKLKDAPPPTFAGGADFAKTTVEAYMVLGPKLTEAGKKLSTADPRDPNSMKVIEDLGTTMKSGQGPLQDLQKLKLSPATTAAIQKIPSCKKIMSIG
jgi:hypothetical protein